MKNVINLTNENMQDTIDTNNIVVVDLWAEWCGPCKMLTPVFAQLAEDYSDNSDVAFGKINVDDERDIAIEFSVTSIPTVLFFKGGENVKREVGFHPKDFYKDIIDSLL